MYITEIVTQGTLVLFINLCVLIIGVFTYIIQVWFYKISKYSLIIFILFSFCLSFIWFSILVYNVSITNTKFLYILENSSISEIFIYKIGSIWSSKEGSLSLWLFLMNSFMLFFICYYKNLISELTLKITIKIFLNILLVFTFLLLYFNNPFTAIYLYTNYEGSGITLLLKDLLLIIHPPLLYMGYIMTCINFGFSYSFINLGTINRIYDLIFFQLNNITSFLLTLGIGLGSFWSYQELGWGGFWTWDPIENLAIIPLLLTIILIHLKSQNFKKIYLTFRLYIVLLSFFMCFLGTLYIRSGILVSIHSFALSDIGINDTIIAITLYFFSYIFVYFNKTYKENNLHNYRLSFLNKKTLVINYSVFTIFTITALIAILTILPYLYKIKFNSDISIGSQLYNDIIFYITLPTLLILLWYYNKTDLFLAYFFFGFIFVVYNYLINIDLNQKIYIMDGFSITVLLIILIYILLLLNIYIKKEKITSLLAHIGVGISLLGIIINFFFSKSTFCNLKFGTSIDFLDYKIIGRKLNHLITSSYDIYLGSLFIVKDNNLIDIATPEKYFSRISTVTTTKPYIYSSLFEDLYIILYNITQDGTPQYIIYYYPGIFCLWFGFFFIIISLIMKNK